MLAPFSIDTYLPSFPSIAHALNATTLQMQQSLSLYMLGFAMMTLIYGSLSDRFGRRPVILWALAGYVISSVACALAKDIHMFLAMRFVQGLFASAGAVVARAVVRDLFRGTQAQKVMSNVMLVFAIAPAIAPVIGGVLEVHFGWQSVFWFLVLLGVSLFSMVMSRLPETLPVDHRHSLHPVILYRNYLHALTHLRFTVLALVVSLNFAGFFLYVASAPRLMFTHLGFAAGEFHWLFVPLVAGVMLGSILSGRLAGRITTARLLWAGFAIMLLAAVINMMQARLLPVLPFSVIAPVVLYALGMALTMPALSLLGLDQLPSHRGLASSLQSFIQMGTNAMVAGLVAPALFDTVEKLATGMLIFNITGLLLFTLLYVCMDGRVSLDHS